MPEASFTVSELLTTARDAIEAELGGAVWVEGEISGFKKGRNNHTYFNLIEKDEANKVVAQLSVALWAGNRAKVNARFKDTGPIRMDEGVRMRIRGPLELWVPGGRLQLSMQDINRYQFRRNRSSDPGLPVVKPGSDDVQTKGGKK